MSAKYFCCAPNCPGYPWKASESRHPCSAAPMTYLEAINLLHHRADRLTGSYVRAVADTLSPDLVTP